MRFSPKTENEIASENLLAPGVYDFEIKEAVEGVSKSSGNDMITMKVQVFDTDGSYRIVFDYLLESVAYKLRHCAEACGLLGHYERGELVADDFVGKAGRCKIAIQKDRAGMYADKNGISDYVVGERRAASASPARQPAMAGGRGELDDEIPF